MLDLKAHLAAERRRRAAGMVDGKHYTSHVGAVKALRRAGNDDEAAGLLLRLIDAIEREAEHPIAGHAGAPIWYFAQLATIYRRAGMPNKAAALMDRQAALERKAQAEGVQLLSDLKG